MALTVTLTPSQSSHFGNAVNDFIIGVTNTSVSSVTVSSLAVSCDRGSSVQIQQPVFLTPNAAPGSGNPTILTTATAYYSCKAVFFSPSQSGPSPQNPAGAGGMSPAATPDGNYTLTATAVASDAATGSASATVAVASTIAPFPLAVGGAWQFAQGSNLINGLIAGVL